MRYDIHVVLEVDPDANFLEVYSDNIEVIAELVTDALYDIDDTIVIDCEVKNAK